jgi:nitrite reductase/ring-hydroxylating ferredoxin subunit
MSSDFVTVATVSDVPRGALLCVDLEGTPLTLANVEGVVYAFEAYCTHQRALLEEGELEGTTILCPWHAGSFDVVTGRVTSPPATEDIQTYPVRMTGDEIQVPRSAVVGSR